MDNVTHTLVAMAIAEAAVQIRRARDPGAVSGSWRRALYLTSIVAGNVPDMDLVLTPLTGGKLGYLLHHRGHTHTLLAGIPQSLLALAVPFFMWLRGTSLWTRRDASWLVVIALLGPFVHILLDYGNSYGVHPFWPFDNSWRYGDRLFIVEPWLWLTLAPPLFFALRGAGGRTVLAALSLVAVALMAVTGLVPAGIAAGVVAWAALMTAAGARLAPGARIATAMAAFLAVVAVFAAAGTQARALAAQELARTEGQRTLDIVLSPMPANPLCWSALAVTTADEGATLALTRGVVAPWPWALAPAACPARMAAGGDAPMTAVAEVSADEEPRRAVVWSTRFAGSLAELRALAAASCEVAAFLRFARAPFWKAAGEGALLLGDLRFDRGEGDGFATLTTPLPAPAVCPPRVPPWVPPLAPVL